MSMNGVETLEFTRSLRFSEAAMATQNECFLQFGDLPGEDVIPAYMMLTVLGHRMLKDINALQWISNPMTIKARRINLQLLSNTELTFFTGKVMEDIGQCALLRFPEEARTLPVVEHHVMECKERYLLAVYRALFEMFGSPSFGETIDPRLFVTNLRKVQDMLSFNIYSNIGMIEYHERVLALDQTKLKNAFKASTLLLHSQILLTPANFWIDAVTCSKQKPDLRRPHNWQIQRTIAMVFAISQYGEETVN
jgi:hypothetical protein